ncbi:MarR family transcriptional regulator [Glaciihabitans arcticus]|uniref:MarR family transcriptional regulator n=1 Tax=Glaciihabitans arcticus TaxID=2668039 RepID=A0A4Q9GRN8_9MICO|nr:MarR family transcriptional regulator [Glaciihabitans arcticus]TBN57626.1 MarR family transcriptional regulator [Glaciihabitans arcticus]
MSRSGADLALLMLSGFRTMADRATVELANRGYEDVRTVHDFALSAIMTGADSASELGRRMAVSKQAAAKTIAALEERGYVSREPDDSDRRRVRIQVTARGLAMRAEGEAIFDEMRAQWETQVGVKALADLETTLRQLVGDAAIRLDEPGSDARDAE